MPLNKSKTFDVKKSLNAVSISLLEMKSFGLFWLGFMAFQPLQVI